jgi:glutaminyl-tRNA synthetase
MTNTEISILNFPNMSNSTKHTVNVGNIIYIDKEDFRMVDSPKYYRLAPNKIVRLKYLGLIKCNDIILKENEPIEILVELLPADYKPAKRVQGTINWVSDIDHLKVEVRKYDHLFPETLDALNSNWKSNINTNSKTIIYAMTDTSIKNAKVYDKFQFERIGYFCVDPDSNDSLVLNMSVPLKESKDK